MKMVPFSSQMMKMHPVAYIRKVKRAAVETDQELLCFNPLKSFVQDRPFFIKIAGQKLPDSPPSVCKIQCSDEKERMDCIEPGGFNVHESYGFRLKETEQLKRGSPVSHQAGCVPGSDNPSQFRGSPAPARVGFEILLMLISGLAQPAGGHCANPEDQMSCFLQYRPIGKS